MAMENELAGKKVRKAAVGKARRCGEKKRAEKTGTRAEVGDAGGFEEEERRQEGLRTAFHHMQRASVVISLMEKGTGEDLRGPAGERSEVV